MLIQSTRQYVVIQALAESLQLLDHLGGDCVSIRVGLNLGKHLVVDHPVVLEGKVVLYDQVNDVEIGQDIAQVVKDAIVVQLLEALLVDGIALLTEKPIHLQYHILGQSDNLV